MRRRDGCDILHVCRYTRRLAHEHAHSHNENKYVLRLGII